MFFYASKLISALIWPSSVITAVLLAGVVGVLAGRGGVWARRCLGVGFALLLVCGFGPVGSILMLPLEQRFERGPVPPDVDGVIILGGFEMGAMTQARGQLSFNEAGERLTEGLRLALSLPTSKVIYTGGEAWLLGSEKSGAATSIGDMITAFGIARERIVLEELSRTTWENADKLRAILKPRPGQRFLLVTSAFHMPRAMGTFRAAGYDVTAWPVDYRTAGLLDALSPRTSIYGGLEMLDVAFKEWVGLVAYRLSGRSTAFWPGDQAAPAVRATPASALRP
jgi:uncharacterized SAM-binding protein YcdF (DUF218 family)